MLVILKKKITSKTKAIIIVHIFGNPVNMDDVMDIAKKYNLKVIEDCSHAHGALWKDKKVGSIGDIGCFSMQGEKLLSAGEGGIMVTNNQEYYERAIALGHYERIGSLPYNKYSKYCFTGMGYKFRIHPIAVAIADCNLNRLDELNDIRNKNAQYLENNIKNTDGIIMQKIYSNATRQYSYHYATYHKEKFCNLSIITFLNALREEGVKYKLCGYGKYHKTSIFTEKYTYANGQTIEENVVETKISLPISEYLSDNIFMLAPRFEKDCKEIIDQYIYAYQKIYQNIEELKYYEEKKLGQGNENSVKIDMLKAIGQLRRYKKSN